jgi:hypothetical protein
MDMGLGVLDVVCALAKRRTFVADLKSIDTTRGYQYDSRQLTLLQRVLPEVLNM